MADINNINFLLPNKIDSDSIKPATVNAPADGKFSDLLKDALSNVNDAQTEASEAVQQVLSGESKDIHSTMIALQKADVSLKLMLEVKNKIVEAYQEVMRTQV
jgi:flagellar hook-basal body complex protein FliE